VTANLLRIFVCRLLGDIDRALWSFTVSSGLTALLADMGELCPYSLPFIRVHFFGTMQIRAFSCLQNTSHQLPQVMYLHNLPHP